VTPRTGDAAWSGYPQSVNANTTSRPRHRLRETARPALLPRSAGVVAVTVGTVLVLSGEADLDEPAQPAPTAGSFPLQPVPMVPDHRDVEPRPFRATGADLAVLGTAPVAPEYTGHCAA
jgi:hypothetical protein